MNNFNGIDKVGSMLNLISQKQKALSVNLANIDTPNYVRQDIDFSQYLNGASNTIETKLSNTLGASPFLTQTSNEKVSPANELMEMQKNSLLYAMAVRNISSTISQMRTAINVGK